MRIEEVNRGGGRTNGVDFDDEDVNGGGGQ